MSCSTFGTVDMIALSTMVGNLVIWIYPYPTPPLKRARAVGYVPPDSHWRDPRRVYISFDPTLSEKVLIAGFKERLKESKAARRVRGAGRRYSLAKLWEALQLYDASKAPDVSLIEVGSSIGTQRPVEGNADLYHAVTERGRAALALATKMIDTARQLPAEWLKTYL